MDKRISFFGIDFGTTNSAAFSFTGIGDDINPISYGDDEGRPFPSIVAINRANGEVITGRDAKDKRNELSENYEYITSIKTIIDSDATWEIAGDVWTPEDVAKEIFLALKKRVERNNENELNDVVVAVPNGFSSAKKHHLRNAAKKAGIDIKMFISEPTAAFCSNYNDLKSCSNVAVFDWGGGTLDVSILNVKNGKINELATSSMQYAGDDIDKKIAEKVHHIFMQQIKKNRPHMYKEISVDDLDAKTKDQLMVRCENAKIKFEDEDNVRISINNYGSFGPVSCILDYEDFRLLVDEDVEKALSVLDGTIVEAHENKVTIDKILCVGGSSKLRPLKEKIVSKYGEDMIYYPTKVMWDIAQGAAISSSRSSSFCSNQDIGIILSDGTFLKLIEKGQRIPTMENTATLAIVSDENKAKFVITDAVNERDRSFIEYRLVDARGFLGEVFEVSCYVDQDFIFRLKIHSNKASDNINDVWTYSKLKIFYDVGGSNS